MTRSQAAHGREHRTTSNTRDVDVLAPALPEAIARAARDFAKEQRRAGDDLADEWLNKGPIQCLPWVERQDGNELWAEHVRSTLANLGRRLGHVV